jgi:bacterial/archaeal transporter family-2 protein
MLLSRTPFAPLFQWGWLQQQPWWLFTGGVFGAFFVVASILAAPRLGATLFVILVVLGQLLGSLWLDNAGALGFAKTAISWQRVVAVGLVMAGVWLVKRY